MVDGGTPIADDASMTKDAAKRVDALAATLRMAIEAIAGDDPLAAREAVQRARAALDDAEAAAIRAALERCQWRVKPASKLLGYDFHSALQKLVAPGRRHEAIGHEIDQHRKAAGYEGGRPPSSKIEAQPSGQKASSRRGRSAPDR